MVQKIASLHGDGTSAAVGCRIASPLRRVRGRRRNLSKGDALKMAKSSNNLVNPNAREAMNRFKMEAANEIGVNLKQGYNGDLTSKQAGSVGGQMVKKMIQAYENGLQ